MPEPGRRRPNIYFLSGPGITQGNRPCGGRGRDCVQGPGRGSGAEPGFDPGAAPRFPWAPLRSVPASGGVTSFPAQADGELGPSLSALSPARLKGRPPGRTQPGPDPALTGFPPPPRPAGRGPGPKAGQSHAAVPTCYPLRDGAVGEGKCALSVPLVLPTALITRSARDRCTERTRVHYICTRAAPGRVGQVRRVSISTQGEGARLGLQRVPLRITRGRPPRLPRGWNKTCWSRRARDVACLARFSCPLKEVVGKLRLGGTVTVRAAEPVPAGGLCFALRAVAHVPLLGWWGVAAGGWGRQKGFW